MPQNTILAAEQWQRYVYARDTGHLYYVQKANKCEEFFAGQQWDSADLQALRERRRPALTINKVLITLSSLFGEQIDTRSEIAFKARYGAPGGNAAALTKVFRFISDNNHLDWLRSEIFADGAITSRGYYDVRMCFDKNLAGNVEITQLNPKNVLPDPDANEYDPDTWNEVITTNWLTADDVALYYNKEDAKELADRATSAWAYGYDSIDNMRDRFAGMNPASQYIVNDMQSVSRIIRVIQRQYKKLSKMKYLVDPKTGDKRKIPDAWNDEHIRNAIQLAAAHGNQLIVSSDIGKRIRWTVTADNFVLHDDWSPYNRLTVVPYFPYFRKGRTIGLVESLIDPQELLNKTLSQELHIVNTSANSGWKVKKGALANMEPDELEERGAETGLVLEVNGDPDKDIVKIQPNQIPQGIDRLSFKAEGFIKSVSGRGDAQLGLSRADVSADALDQNKDSSDATVRKALDNLQHTDHLLARNILDLVQEYYTDPRIMNITHNDLTGEMDELHVNEPDPSTGEILNDLTLGEYDVVVTTTPARRTLEESQFEQAVALRKDLGIQIPDEFIIENSNLLKKGDIVKAMKAQAETPMARLQAQVQALTLKLQVAEQKGEASRLEADATLKNAKAAKTVAETAGVAKEAAGGDDEAQLEQQKHEQEMQRDQQKHDQEMQHERERHQQDIALKEKQAADDRRMKRAQAILAARDAARQPAAPQKGA